MCRSVVEEIDSAIQKIDPKRTVEVGSYRLDSMGNQKQKTVSNFCLFSDESLKLMILWKGQVGYE